MTIYKQPSILLVEDHPFQLIGLQMHLNQLGFYRLASALDSAEALAMLQEGRRFDILLCDQYLSDGSGLQLIEKVHAHNGARHALIISGVDGPDVLRKLQRRAQRRGLPVRGYFSKPLNAPAFIGVLGALGYER